MSFLEGLGFHKQGVNYEKMEIGWVVRMIDTTAQQQHGHAINSNPMTSFLSSVFEMFFLKEPNIQTSV